MPRILPPTHMHYEHDICRLTTTKKLWDDFAGPRRLTLAFQVESPMIYSLFPRKE